VADPIAIWGAVTGTIGAAVALSREAMQRRRRLAVRHGIHYNVSRTEPGTVTLAWATVEFWNAGGRPLAVQHAGFSYSTFFEDGTPRSEYRMEIAMSGAKELPVDGPSQKVTTPLAPMMAAGLDPFSPVQAFVVTTGDQAWFGPLEPLVHYVPPFSRERLIDDFVNLTEAAEVPPAVEGLIWLMPEEPYLPEGPLP
jgi:hypothetical protein